MKLLVVKTSSIGDLLHCFPAVSDALKAIPGLEVDWLVEKSLAPVVGWHGGVRQVIPVAYRFWRHHPVSGYLTGRWHAFRRRLKQEHYDLIIDAQGLYKSAVMTRLADGKERHGFDFSSAREKLAPFAYDRRHEVAGDQHAIERQRQLFAAALGYPLPQGPLDFGLDKNRLKPSPVKGRYLVFLHGTAWRTKRWPAAQWRGLAQLAGAAGYDTYLPYGTGGDERRARRIALGQDRVKILETPGLDDAAALLSGAAGAVSVDTGLGHLAAALGLPTVALYGPTSPALTGTRGAHQSHLVTREPCAPCRDKICAITGNAHRPGPCMFGLTVAEAWLKLQAAMAGA